MRPNLKIKELFFNHPTRYWHFEQLLKTTGLSRAQTNEWLHTLQKEGLVKRVKPQGKMPYYLANHQNPHYQNSKRLYALEKLHESGILDYLSSLENTKVIVLFGSFSRWDWHEGSDIDLFVYGEIDNIYVGRFKSKLNREVQIISGKDQSDLSRMGPALLQNVIRGITLKGSLPSEVITHAAV